MERDTHDDGPVALRAEKDGQIFSWDPHPAVAEELREFLESSGWTVTISSDGPARRRTPRIDRPKHRWSA